MKEDSIVKNFIYNSGYQIISIITPLITSPYISRKLGALPLGVYSYTYAIASYFLIFAILGVKNYGNRSIARVRENREERSRTFCGIYLFQFITSLISILGYMLYLIAFSPQNIKIAIIQGLLVLSATFDITWFFFGMEQFKTTTIRNIVVKVFTVVLILVCVKTPNDLWKYTMIMAGSVLASQLIMWPFIPKYVDWYKPTVSQVLAHFKPNCILFIPVIATNLYKYMDKLMLGNMSEMNFLGYYENAERLVQIPNSLVTALGTVMLPRMSNIVKKGQNEQYKNLIKKSMVFAVFLSSAFCFGILTISNSFVPLFFGKEFIPVIELLYLFAPIMIFISWADVVRTQYLLPNSKDTSFLVSVLAGTVVNFAINCALIPRIEARGAAIGTLFAEFTVCALQTIAVRKELPILNYFKICIPFVFNGLIMWIAVHKIYVKNDFVTVFVQILMGAIIYVLLSFIWFRYINKEKLFNDKI